MPSEDRPFSFFHRVWCCGCRRVRLPKAWWRCTLPSPRWRTATSNPPPSCSPTAPARGPSCFLAATACTRCKRGECARRVRVRLRVFCLRRGPGWPGLVWLPTGPPRPKLPRHRRARSVASREFLVALPLNMPIGAVPTSRRKPTLEHIPRAHLPLCRA